MLGPKSAGGLKVNHSSAILEAEQVASPPENDATFFNLRKANLLSGKRRH
jgi:hypothetical protein